MEYLLNAPAPCKVHYRVGLFLFCFLFVLAALGLRCCSQAFSTCGEWGLLFVAVHEPLIAVASLVVEHRLSSRDAQAQLPHSTWGLPRVEVELLSPALATGCLTTGPPGKSPALGVFKSSKQPETDYCLWL